MRFLLEQALGHGLWGMARGIKIVMERKLLRKACVKMLGLSSALPGMKLFSEMCFIKQSLTQYRASEFDSILTGVIGNGFLGGGESWCCIFRLSSLTWLFLSPS